MGSRRNAREIALQILFQLDVQDRLTDAQAIELFFRHLAEGEHDEADRAFAERIVRGVREDLAGVDAVIGRASRNWRIERMARVDRNLLRLAVWELKHERDVPAKVAINEAIEIAKRYGTAESPAFVNGVLDRCLEELGGR